MLKVNPPKLKEWIYNKFTPELNEMINAVKVKKLKPIETRQTIYPLKDLLAFHIANTDKIPKRPIPEELHQLIEESKIPTCK
jgi:hypothetical protein